jgi:hypothetical protein
MAANLRDNREMCGLAPLVRWNDSIYGERCNLIFKVTGIDELCNLNWDNLRIMCVTTRCDRKKPRAYDGKRKVVLLPVNSQVWWIGLQFVGRKVSKQTSQRAQSLGDNDLKTQPLRLAYVGLAVRNVLNR